MEIFFDSSAQSGEKPYSHKIKREKFVTGGAFKGCRSKKSIMKTVLHNLAPLRTIYNKRLRIKPELHGIVKIRFKVITSGEVIYCKVVEATLVDKNMHEELVNEITGWKFDTLDQQNDTTEVIYPFVFNR